MATGHLYKLAIVMWAVPFAVGLCAGFAVGWWVFG